MSLDKGSPGPVARSAFRTGMALVGFVGVAAIVGLYFAGTDPLVTAYSAVLLFPVYLVLAAAFLNAWLGYGGDTSRLRPVTKPVNPETTTRNTPQDNKNTHDTVSGGNPIERLPAVVTSLRAHVVLTMVTFVIAGGLIATGLPDRGILLALLAGVFSIIVIVGHLQPHLEQRYRADEPSRGDRDASSDRSVFTVTPKTKADLSVAILLTLIVAAITMTAENFA
ncbi:MAG: hypothetical protein A07HR60_00421 [uncultured archaeon A07HR60]|nr:MAG: hypothetical protein A07HR60_00421 [uncultured archaeon A07HR60]